MEELQKQVSWEASQLPKIKALFFKTFFYSSPHFLPTTKGENEDNYEKVQK